MEIGRIVSKVRAQGGADKPVMCDQGQGRREVDDSHRGGVVRMAGKLGGRRRVGSMRAGHREGGVLDKIEHGRPPRRECEEEWRHDRQTNRCHIREVSLCVI